MGGAAAAVPPLWATRRLSAWPTILTLAVAVSSGLTGVTPSTASAQTPFRDRLADLPVEPLRFQGPAVEERTLSGGVTVFFVEDRSLPLVNVLARFDGGYARFPRDHYAAGTALPSLLRNGGAEGMSPDSVDRTLERYAIQTTFGSAGDAVNASINTLTEHLPTAMDVWGRLLTQPAFDTASVSVWRDQTLENVRRRGDNPARLAYSEFNRLMYGDHPIGWEMDEEDLLPERMSVDRLRELHGRILCRDNLILGVAGDVSWGDIEPRLEALVQGLAPCAGELPASPVPDVGAEPGVYLIPRSVNQSTVVLAQPVSLPQGPTDDYFASRIGNAILGAGGFSSRLLARLRTREGITYSASSLWTTPRRYDGILGATTRTRSETTGEAIRLTLEAIDEMGRTPPSREEVGTSVDQAVNGFVFSFQSPLQVVARRMSYRAIDLPDDWLEEYLDGLQRVRPRDVREVFADYLDLDRVVILVVGDPDAITTQLEAFGPVRLYPSGWPQSRP